MPSSKIAQTFLPVTQEPWQAPKRLTEEKQGGGYSLDPSFFVSAATGWSRVVT